MYTVVVYDNSDDSNTNDWLLQVLNNKEVVPLYKLHNVVGEWFGVGAK